MYFSSPATSFRNETRADCKTHMRLQILFVQSALITKLGGKPDNSSVTQLAELFTSAPQVNTGIMRDAAGRAKVAAPVAENDIARKAETDAEAKARAAGGK